MDPTPAPDVTPSPTPRRARIRPAWLRAWPVYVLLVAVLGVTWYVTRARKEAGLVDPVLPVTIQLESNVEVKFGEVTMQGRQKGVQRWVITSPTVALSKDGRYTDFVPDPRGRFYNLKDWKAREDVPSEKVRSMDWKAKRARYDSFSEDLEMHGKVVLTTDEKDIIKTEKVAYKARTKRVHMPGAVVIQMADGTYARADGLEANADAEVFELKGHVDFKAPTGEEEKL